MVIGSVGSSASWNSALSSVFDLLDRPTSQAKDSAEITLAGQSSQPVKDITALEKPADLDADFEHLFAGMAPVEVDLNQGYAQSTQADFSQKSQAATEAVSAPISVQDTPLPGSQAALPKQLSAIKPLFLEESSAKPANSSANSNLSRAKTTALVLDDEFSDLFLGDKSQKMEALLKDEIADVDKLHAAADESWAEALLQEETDKNKRKEEIGRAHV